MAEAHSVGEAATGAGCFVDLYWLPVGAGTSRLQQWSLDCWEAVMAAVDRRDRARLFHPGLKLGLDDGSRYTMEIAPAFTGQPAPPLMTGPVGFRGANRSRFFRYQLVCYEAETLPDEEWAVDSPVRVSAVSGVSRAVLDLGHTVPAFTWGRRVPGTHEMWTSASVVAWLLVKAGVDARAIVLPPGGRAPGWHAGIHLAEQR